MFGISLEETTVARRGFRVTDPGTRQRLELIGQTFVEGYHAALEQSKPETFACRLSAVELEFRGFAFEGAAMGLALLDTLTPWNRTRWRAFLSGPAANHLYMVHVGVGWAAARVPWVRRNIEYRLGLLVPLLRWLAVDGYGFHEGYFYWRQYVEGQRIPEQLSGYASRAFDQGLGRSLWFSNGADVARIPLAITDFPVSRHADLWSGVGLACAYAGGVDRAAIEALAKAAGPYRSELAQGVAFAAKARQRAGNPAGHTELASEVICGMSADRAAEITDAALADLPPDAHEPSYEVWRRRIRTHFATEETNAGINC